MQRRVPGDAGRRRGSRSGAAPTRRTPPRCACSIITPFGVPVEPEVNRMWAERPGSRPAGVRVRRTRGRRGRTPRTRTRSARRATPRAPTARSPPPRPGRRQPCVASASSSAGSAARTMRAPGAAGLALSTGHVHAVRLQHREHRGDRPRGLRREHADPVAGLAALRRRGRARAGCSDVLELAVASAHPRAEHQGGRLGRTFGGAGEVVLQLLAHVRAPTRAEHRPRVLQSSAEGGMSEHRGSRVVPADVVRDGRARTRSYAPTRYGQNVW